MPEYLVMIREIMEREVLVEAKDKNEARRKALDTSQWIADGDPYFVEVKGTNEKIKEAD